jgi:PTS system glucose-specific IIC component
MLINAGLIGDVINFVIACLAFFGINFGVFNFCIKKFKIPTPGRLGNYDEEESENSDNKGKVDAATANDVLSLKIIDIVHISEDSIEGIILSTLR